MKRKMFRVLGCLAVVGTLPFLQGCVLLPTIALGAGAAYLLTEPEEEGRDFDDTKVSEIVKGTTTDEEIIGFFGEPQTRKMSGDGTVVWEYFYELTTTYSRVEHIVGTAGDDYSELLKVRLRDGVVEDYEFTVTGSPNSATTDMGKEEASEPEGYSTTPEPKPVIP